MSFTKRAGRVRDAREAVASMGITVAPLTATMAEHAAELRVLHGRLRLPAAMTLACVRALDGELLSYDQRLTRLAGRGDAR